MKHYTLTDEEYERTEIEIYNDIPITLDQSDSYTFKEFDQKVAESFMVEGEEYRQVDIAPHKIMTTYGRMINTHTSKIIKPAITGMGMYWNIGKCSFRLNREFKKYNIEYNHELACKKYLEYGWDHMWNGSNRYKSLKHFIQLNYV